MMRRPDMPDPKSSVLTLVYPHTEVNLTTRQSESRHFRNGAKAERTGGVRDQRIFFELEKFRQEAIHSQRERNG